MPTKAIIQPSYQVVIISPITGAIVALYDAQFPFDLRYSRLLNDAGIITLTLPYTAAVRAAFTLDCFIEVYRTNPLTGQLAKEDTYLARLFNRMRQGDLEQYIVTGVQLNDLIKRRVVNPADDPAAQGGYSVYAGAADTVMRNYAYYNLGPGASLLRQFPNLTIPTVNGTGNPVGYNLRYDNLYTAVFADATARGGIDFNIQRTTGANLELDIGVIGTDRRQSTNYPNTPYVGFDPKRGNLQDPNLLIDRKKEMTVVYELGSGQGTAQQSLILASSTVNDSPFNRIEFTDTAGNTAKGDTTTLLTAATASLKKNSGVSSFSYKLIEATPGNTYQQDWFLGDLVTVSYDEYVSNLRITGVEVFVSQAGQTVTPTAAAI